MTAGRVRLAVDVACRGGALEVVYEAAGDRGGVWKIWVRGESLVRRACEDGVSVELDGQGMGRLVESIADGGGGTEADISGAPGRAVEVVLFGGSWVWQARWGWKAVTARVDASEVERLVAIVSPWLPLVAPLR